MKKTKAQIEEENSALTARFAVAQSVIERLQGKVNAAEMRATAAETDARKHTQAARLECYQMGEKVADLQRRLLRRAGKVEALQDMIFALLTKRRNLPRED